MCDIDHEYTDEIVCPWCGYKFEDSWEFSCDDEDLGLIDCYECDKQFYASRNIRVTYSTEKPTYGKCKDCDKENVVLEDYHSSMGSYDGLCLPCGEKAKKELWKKYIQEIEELESQ